MPLFRELSVAEPLIVELRELSRIDQELKVERVGLGPQRLALLSAGSPEEVGRVLPPTPADLFGRLSRAILALPNLRQSIRCVHEDHGRAQRGRGADRSRSPARQEHGASQAPTSSASARGNNRCKSHSLTNKLTGWKALQQEVKRNSVVKFTFAGLRNTQRLGFGCLRLGAIVGSWPARRS
jgi:hypothetical protein